MIISLIGMSGSGKSYWSRQLEKKGFIRYCCDDLIEQKLEKELQRHNYRGIADVARWMGQPYEPQYQETSAHYLTFEKEVLQEIFTEVAAMDNDTNIVIDTTGSVIYCGDSLLQQLADLSKIIYLSVPESVQHEMYQLYLADPKPVIWGESFQQLPKESVDDALKRCYRLLLIDRTHAYEKLAQVSLDSFDLRRQQPTPDNPFTLFS